MNAAARQHDFWKFCALALLLVWAPLPLGSNRNWSVCVLALLVGPLLASAWLSEIRRGASPLSRLAPAAVPLWAMLLFSALVLAQWLGGVDGRLFSSADPFQSLIYLLSSLTYTGLFASVLLLVRSLTRARTLALVLVASGVAQALLAIGLLATHAEYQVLAPDAWYPPQATGSFVNRNHLAAYLYLCLSAGIGLLLGSLVMRRAARSSLRDHARRALEFVLSARMALRVILLVMVIALVLTRSRMGNAAFFTSLIVLGGAVALTTPGLRLKALVLVASLVVVDVVVIGQWVGLERVLQRIDGTALAMEDQRSEETVEARLEPARHTLPMIMASPWTGHGGGSYHTAFPAFKSRAMLLHLYYFDHAHNDYAEIAADTGMVGLGLLAVAMLASIRRTWRLLRPRQPALTRGIAYAALMATSCMLLHSWVDFNLQVPANALTFVAILGLLWAVPSRADSSR